MTSSKRLAGALTLGWALCAFAPEMSARAQQRTATAQELETARMLYKEGKVLRASGDLRGALEKLQAAHALGNTPVTGIELARTYVLAGLLVEARETALYIARILVADDETAKSAEARTDAARLAEELEPRIPTLVVRVPGLLPNESARVSIDRVEVPEAATSEAQKVNPGRHEVVVRTDEGRVGRDSADVVEGETREVAVSLPAPAPEVQPTAPAAVAPPTTANGSPLAGIGLAVALVGVATGAVTGFVALQKKDDITSSDECPNDRCSPGSAGARDLYTARTMATIANVAFALAGAGALLGLIGLTTSGPASPGNKGGKGSLIWLGFGPAGLHGTF